MSNRLAFPSDRVPHRRSPADPAPRLGTDDGARQEREVVDFSPLVPPDYLISARRRDRAVDLGFGRRRAAPVRRPLGPHHAYRASAPSWCPACAMPTCRQPSASAWRRPSRTSSSACRSASCAACASIVTGFVATPGRLHRQRAVRHGQRAGARRRAFGVGQLSQHPVAARQQARVDARLLRPAAQRRPQRRPGAAGRRRDPRRPDRHRRSASSAASTAPAIFELKPDETMADALRMAGGFTAVADTHAPGGGTRRRARHRARRADRHGARPTRPNCAAATCCAPSMR